VLSSVQRVFSFLDEKKTSLFRRVKYPFPPCRFEECLLPPLFYSTSVEYFYKEEYLEIVNDPPFPEGLISR